MAGRYKFSLSNKKLDQELDFRSNVRELISSKRNEKRHELEEMAQERREMTRIQQQQDGMRQERCGQHVNKEQERRGHETRKGEYV